MKDCSRVYRQLTKIMNSLRRVLPAYDFENEMFHTSETENRGSWEMKFRCQYFMIVSVINAIFFASHSFSFILLFKFTIEVEVQF
jgi:hypothetical protein